MMGGWYNNLQRIDLIFDKYDYGQTILQQTISAFEFKYTDLMQMLLLAIY